jgi:hypothetical protein
MVGAVVERFRVERPGAAITTIHDSLLVLPEDVDYATATIIDEFGAIGLAPQLKVKDLKQTEVA